MNIINNALYSYVDPAKVYVIGQAAIGYAALPLINIIHESGHAIVAHLLYRNAKPKIELTNYGYGNASCSFTSISLSKVGEWVGASNARALVSAAGPVIQMTTSLALLKFFPGNGISFISLVGNGCYAFSALSQKDFYTKQNENNNEHDFINVKIFKGRLAAETLIVTSVALGIFGTYSLLEQAYANPFISADIGLL